MDSVIIAAIITAVGAIVAACIGLIKRRSAGKRISASPSTEATSSNHRAPQSESPIILEHNGNKSQPPIHERNADKFFDRIITEVDLPDVISKALSSMTPVSILLLDIDGQDGINKCYGQDVGDKVIITVGSLVDGSASSKYSGRCGDDTFYVILIGHNLLEAKDLGTNLLSNIQKYDWQSIAHGLYVTCSIGIAEFRISEPLEQAATRAAIGYQHAKTIGGNKVELGPQYLSRITIPKFESFVS